MVYEPQKLPLIKYLLKTTPYKNALIFCSRKQTVKQLRKELSQGGFNIEEIHSDLEQSKRESVLSSFTSGRIPLLVATDILSRGIDIDTIDLVVNYDVPGDGEDYVHRIGRTARAEAEGAAYTLVGEKEQNKFAAIEKLLEKEVEKGPVPKELGETPAYTPRRRDSSKPGGGPRKFYRSNKGR